MSMQDGETTVAQLKRLMDEFVVARDWRQYHDPKNLSTSIAIEAAELMEHFQWLHSDKLDEVMEDAGQMAEIREEVADIFAYILSFANTMKIDLASALADKMKKNELKYPIERFYGSFRPKESY